MASGPWELDYNWWPLPHDMRNATFIIAHYGPVSRFETLGPRRKENGLVLFPAIYGSIFYGHFK